MADTLFHIERIAAQVPGTASLECLEGQHAVTFTLKNLTTGVYDVITMCVANNVTNPCDVLTALSVAGYQTEDYDTVCP